MRYVFLQGCKHIKYDKSLSYKALNMIEKNFQLTKVDIQVMPFHRIFFLAVMLPSAKHLDGKKGHQIYISVTRGYPGASILNAGPNPLPNQ